LAYSFVFILSLFVSGGNWHVMFLRERRRANRLLSSLRQSRLDCTAYRALVEDLQRKNHYLKYK